MCRERPHSTCLAPAPPLLPAKRTVGHAASEAALVPASAPSRLLPSVPPKLRPRHRDEAAPAPAPAPARPGDQLPRPRPEDETDQDYDIPAASPELEAEAREYEEYDEPVPAAAKNTGIYISTR